MNAKMMSPVFLLTVLFAMFGSALPILSLVRGGGLSGSLNDAGLMVALWGISPFVLPPVAAWMARRPWVRVMVLSLTGLAVLFSIINYGLVVPRQDAARATASYFLLPLWQWPMAVLGALLALVVPASGEPLATIEEGSQSQPQD